MSITTHQYEQFKQGVTCYQQQSYSNSITHFVSSMTQDLTKNSEFVHSRVYDQKKTSKMLTGKFESLTNLSSCFIKLKQYQKSLKLCYRAMQLNPYVSSPYYNAASIQIRKEQYHQAIASIRCALSCEYLKKYENQYQKQFLDEAICLAPNNLQAIKYRISHNSQLLKFIKLTKSTSSSFFNKTSFTADSQIQNNVIQQAIKQLQSDVQTYKRFNKLYEVSFHHTGNKKSQPPNMFITSIKTPFILQGHTKAQQTDNKFSILSSQQKLDTLMQLKSLREQYLQLLQQNPTQNNFQDLISDLSIEQPSTHCTWDVTHVRNPSYIQVTDIFDYEEIVETSFQLDDSCESIQLNQVKFDEGEPRYTNDPFVCGNKRDQDTFSKKAKGNKGNSRIHNKENINMNATNKINRSKANDRKLLHTIAWNNNFTNDSVSSKSRHGVKESQQVKKIQLNERQKLNSSIISILDYEDTHSNQSFNHQHYHNHHPQVSMIQSVMVTNPPTQPHCHPHPQPHCHPKRQQNLPAKFSHMRNRSYQNLNYANQFSTTSKHLSNSQYKQGNLLLQSKSHYKMLACSKCSLDHQNDQHKQKNVQLKINLTEIYTYQRDYTQLQTYCIVKHQGQEYKTQLSKGRFPNWKQPILLHVDCLDSLRDSSICKLGQIEAEKRKIKIQIWAKPLHYKKDPKLSQLNSMHEFIGQKQIDLMEQKWIKRKIVLENQLSQRERKKTAYMHINLEKIKL